MHEHTLIPAILSWCVSGFTGVKCAEAPFYYMSPILFTSLIVQIVKLSPEVIDGQELTDLISDLSVFKTWITNIISV